MSHSTENLEIQHSFATVIRAVSELRKKVSSLEKAKSDLVCRNDALTQQIDALHVAEEQGTSVQPRRARSGKEASTEKRLASLEQQLASTEQDNKKLRKEVSRHRRTIKRLERKELVADANELLEEAVHGMPDEERHMRKLLRRFSDLMALNVLGEDECSVCFDNLRISECSSFPCQHILCNNCVSKLPDMDTGAGPAIACPSCREKCTREDLDSVEHTAQDQWDKLLDIANEFGEIDQRRVHMDTSDEEEEERLRENFINDQTSHDPSSTASEAPETEEEATEQSLSPRHRLAQRALAGDRTQVDEDEVADETSAVSSSLLPYAGASSSDRKRRMQELAAQRAKKPRL
ncbi:hypothetical protein K488DRAFT_82861 [Vararia minispora EC-137]|uniref:Uncharacterized protein n=1 Tax=Vararia minispora EC-137 TaxID=1314806 RepID=A0ACB8QVM3_9AGAM|nr:hypothetical protein K488DRAFT_82861 [Vararia minispora EC-137]